MKQLITTAVMALKAIQPSTPQILTGIGIAGTVSTAVLAARGAQEAEYCLDTAAKQQPLTEQAKLVWRCYIPAVVSGTITIGCIYGASRVNARQAAALTAAYTLSERALFDYRDKVTETLGEVKEQAIRDDIAQDKVLANPNPTIVVEGTDVLTCELHTMRYFKSDMESLRKAQNDINSRMLRHDTACLSDLYDLLDIPNTATSWAHGWEAGKPMEMEISAVLAENGKPCLAFDYNYINVL